MTTKYKTQVPGVRMMVRRIAFADPAEAAVARERFNSSTAMLLKLLERYEEQEAPILVGQIGFHTYRVAQHA